MFKEKENNVISKKLQKLFCFVVITVMCVLISISVNASILEIVPENYDAKSFKKYAVNMTGTQQDYSRLLKVSTKKNGILSICYSVTQCNDTFLKISVYKDVNCTTKVSSKFAYIKRAEQGVLEEYLPSGSYYVKVETSPNFNKPVSALLAFAQLESSDALTLNSTNRYVNTGSDQYLKFSLKTSQLLQFNLEQYKNDEGFYLSICNSKKNVISNRKYVGSDTKVFFALHKGDYYLKISPKSVNADSVFSLTSKCTTYKEKKNYTMNTSLKINTNTVYKDLLYTGDSIDKKVVYKLVADKPISAKIKTDAKFSGNAYIRLTGKNVSQKIFNKYFTLKKGTYYLTFSKRSARDGGIVTFKVLAK